MAHSCLNILYYCFILIVRKARKMGKIIKSEKIRNDLRQVIGKDLRWVLESHDLIPFEIKGFLRL